MSNPTTPTDKTPKARLDVYQIVTDTIIQHLEEGVVPWQRKWNGGNSHPFSIPVNGHTEKAYEGINILLLWAAASKNEYETNEWATVKQWNKEREFIKKDQHGSIIVFFEMKEREVDGEIERVPLLKYSKVFNRAQLKSYVPSEAKSELPSLVERIEHVEKFVANTKATIKHEGYQACYIPSQDVIHMPSQNSFINTDEMTATEAYYSTLFHELAHWSGNEKRLDRKLNNSFGSNPYAGEELIAEISAAYLCAELQITKAPKRDHANYIATWLAVLKQNKHAIVGAARSASKAVNFLKTLQSV